MLNHERFSGRTILFVDDDQRWLRLIERWFADSSYDCVFVNSGKQALAEITKQHFDVVVSDISMPEVTGIDLMNVVKEKLPNAARIVMSGKMDLVGSIEAINKGSVFRYLVKPCDGKEIKLAVYSGLLCLEREEKQGQRRDEIRRFHADRIRQMTKSIAALERKVSGVHAGIVKVVNRLVPPSPEQVILAEQSLKTLRQLLAKTKLDLLFKKQLELVVNLRHAVIEQPCNLSLNAAGQLARSQSRPVSRGAAEQVFELLDGLDYSVTSRILEKVMACEPVATDSSLDDEINEELGYALVCLASDIATLAAESGDDEGSIDKIIGQNAGLYGERLVVELFELK